MSGQTHRSRHRGLWMSTVPCEAPTDSPSNALVAGEISRRAQRTSNVFRRVHDAVEKLVPGLPREGLRGLLRGQKRIGKPYLIRSFAGDGLRHGENERARRWQSGLSPLARQYPLKCGKPANRRFNISGNPLSRTLAQKLDIRGRDVLDRFFDAPVPDRSVGLA